MVDGRGMRASLPRPRPQAQANPTGSRKPLSLVLPSVRCVARFAVATARFFLAQVGGPRRCLAHARNGHGLRGRRAAR